MRTPITYCVTIDGMNKTLSIRLDALCAETIFGRPALQELRRLADQLPPRRGRATTMTRTNW